MRIVMSLLTVWPLWSAGAFAGEIVPVLDGAAEIELPDGYHWAEGGVGDVTWDRFEKECPCPRPTHVTISADRLWSREEFFADAAENRVLRRADPMEPNLYAAWVDPVTGLVHGVWLGGFLHEVHAFNYLICNDEQDLVVCVSGRNRAALLAFQWAPPDPEDVEPLTDREILDMLAWAGNADVLEGVMESFRWKEP